MAGRFNPADYDTVASRIKKFYDAHEDGRIETRWANDYEQLDGKRTWVVMAKVFLSAGDQANQLPKATGYAVETDGTGGANNGSALENAETSAIGRALANMNLSGDLRASREEMAKVQRLEAEKALINNESIDALATLEAAREMWLLANRLGVGPEVMAKIKAKADSFAE